MMDEYYLVAKSLPEPFAGKLVRLCPEAAALVQEIRMRAGQEVAFTIGGSLVPCTRYLPSAAELLPDEKDLQSCFLQLCRHSAYVYEEELRQGFFTIAGGNRIGVAGEWGQGRFDKVTALNLRVARWITCRLPPALEPELRPGKLGGILVAGPPGSGKTTFLRSITQRLCRGGAIVCVVDEREELLAGAESTALRARGISCDTYSRCPRAQAVEMALRCMNPQIIVCDELGSMADAAALEQGVATGVRFVASVHCDAPDRLKQKPQLKRLLDTGAFETAVFLEGRARAGRAACVTHL